eukprot:m.17745 g.17745  ORF g.17745 m.17745 type:complete len:141 (+) comp11657_c0_seq2:52-474(+)
MSSVRLQTITNHIQQVSENSVNSMAQKSPITTHILDTALGKPGAGVNVSLWQQTSEGQWGAVGQGITNSDGRCPTLVTDANNFTAGIYRIDFETAKYFKDANRETFFPMCQITFEVKDTTQHYHVPLLLSPFSYSTYRGS